MGAQGAICPVFLFSFSLFSHTLTTVPRSHWLERMPLSSHRLKQIPARFCVHLPPDMCHHVRTPQSRDQALDMDSHVTAGQSRDLAPEGTLGGEAQGNHQGT